VLVLVPVVAIVAVIAVIALISVVAGAVRLRGFFSRFQGGLRRGLRYFAARHRGGGGLVFLVSAVSGWLSLSLFLDQPQLMPDLAPTADLILHVDQVGGSKV